MNRFLTRAVRWATRVGGPEFRRMGLARALAAAATTRGRKRCGGPVRRVVHVSPAYFDPDSYIGGGERYATSLARAMAELVDTRLVSFGPRRVSFRQGSLRVEVYPTRELISGSKYDPYAWGFLTELRRADVVHCHQYTPFVTTAAVLASAALGRASFVSDLGGGGWNDNQRVSTHQFVTRFCPISRFAIQDFERAKATVIYGGVDPIFLAEPPSGWPRKRQVLFVGRLLPHKGINYLIEAVPPGVDLQVMGSAYDPDYFLLLRKLAENKRVTFVTNATDEDVLAAYRESTVTVLPTVYTDCYGRQYARPELLGLVLLESMACGTPVVCTAVGGMPEYVTDGQTGFVVPPNDPTALRHRLTLLLDDPALAERMGAAGRQVVEEQFTWRRVADRCLKAYEEVNALLE
jgi:glycosyltransferase involved in cell wall biosynthesis